MVFQGIGNKRISLRPIVNTIRGVSHIPKKLCSPSTDAWVSPGVSTNFKKAVRSFCRVRLSRRRRWLLRRVSQLAPSFVESSAVIGIIGIVVVDLEPLRSEGYTSVQRLLQGSGPGLG